MENLIGIKLRNKGKQDYYDPVELKISKGDMVIVESDKGIVYGVATSINPIKMDTASDNKKYRKILRKVTDEDRNRIKTNTRIEKEVLEYCLDRIDNRKIPMKIIDIGSLLDGSKLIFYFTAEGRIDFRELVKDMAYKFRARIEMIQISVRDGARMLNIYGPCGKLGCCSSFLTEFEPITIRMARNQDMILNPAKISGMCGKLMCCIAFEYEPCNDKKGKSCPKKNKNNKGDKGDKCGRVEKGEKGDKLDK